MKKSATGAAVVALSSPFRALELSLLVLLLLPSVSKLEEEGTVLEIEIMPLLLSSLLLLACLPKSVYVDINFSWFSSRRYTITCSELVQSVANFYKSINKEVDVKRILAPIFHAKKVLNYCSNFFP